MGFYIEYWLSKYKRIDNGRNGKNAVTVCSRSAPALMCTSICWKQPKYALDHRYTQLSEYFLTQTSTRCFGQARCMLEVMRATISSLKRLRNTFTKVWSVSKLKYKELYQNMLERVTVFCRSFLPHKKTPLQMELF